MFKSSQDSYRSPGIAFLWSVMLPGLGQLYNRDYVLGFFMIAIEIYINTMSGLNMSIYYAFNGELLQSCESADFHWLLFYPSTYTFSMWQAYNHAKDNNQQLMEKGVAQKDHPIYCGVFIGMTIGLLLGVIWCVGESPIFGGLLLGAVGTTIGYVIEKKFMRGQNQKRNSD